MNGQYLSAHVTLLSEYCVYRSELTVSTRSAHMVTSCVCRRTVDQMAGNESVVAVASTNGLKEL